MANPVYIFKSKTLGPFISLIFTLLVVFLVISLPPYQPKTGPPNRILFQTQSFYGDIKMIQVGPYHCLMVNAIAQSCLDSNKQTDTSYIQQLAKLIEHKKPKKVLMLGMAGGAALSVLPAETNIDVVELDPKVVAVAQQFNLIPDRTFNIFYDDARHFIERKPGENYDLVIMDLALGDTPPLYLLTQESLQNIHKLLTTDGVLFLRLGIYPKTDDLFFTAVARTLLQVFPEITLVSVQPDILADLSFVAFTNQDNLLEWRQENPLKIDVNTLVQAPIVTDNYNPLEKYFLPHLLDLRSGERTLGSEVYLAN